MRNLLITAVIAIVAVGTIGLFFALTPTQAPPAAKAAPSPAITDPAAAPDTIVFEASNGNVTFTHKLHYERVGGECETCHTAVFPQSREPINYKKATHRAAEATLTSCAACHAVGAMAFAADSNCIKCHM